MITYPSTHGVFEETVREVCEITHRHGGQVYIDGANMNANGGPVAPRRPGRRRQPPQPCTRPSASPTAAAGRAWGRSGVKAHLAPHLPGHPATAAPKARLSATPYGSPSLLPISWAYCLMMGGEGITQATRVAILNANYIAKRLEGAFEVLYTGPTGRIAHECILDTRPFEASAGITVEDIAKRLIDCGFHAPTMSWPVAGTLMVEPTRERDQGGARPVLRRDVGDPR